MLARFGIQFTNDNAHLKVKSPGMKKWNEPGSEILDCGNSGTTARLLTGLLSGLPFTVTLDGDESLRKRPMQRVLTPLINAGGIFTNQNSGKLPLTVHGQKIQAFNYSLPIPSAQVKSALIYAALNATGKSVITEAIPTRDHSERLAKLSHIRLYKHNNDIIVNPYKHRLMPFRFYVPSDPSAAAFWIAAALLGNKSKILLKNVSLNPRRIEMLRVLQKAGGHIQIQANKSFPEPMGDILVHSSKLKAFSLAKRQIPLLIDEIPLLALLATQATGVSILRHLTELKIKESDRLTAITENLSIIGLKSTRTDDTLIIEGPQTISGGEALTHGDHRIAMMMAVAGLISQDGIKIPDPECAKISDPFFFQEISSLQ
ncbi:MAG TPA: 3-phosphoshikimate 1-carboxyvinyltransferase [Candidatus Marinimicrobia bacterium]|nr:3-phosphoshikimate 1-carboxyvinyltransferase [Candidatus Neomarinimicrobiota bacterium]